MARNQFCNTVLAALLIVVAPGLLEARAQEKQDKQKPTELSPKQLRDLDKKALKPPSGAGFFIAPIETEPHRFSVLIQDADGRAVADAFGRAQIETLEALLLDARKFADTEEELGKTSRFAAKDDRSFAIDVQKSGNQSRFFFLLNAQTGKISVDVGAIKRGDKNPPEILFTTIITRVQAAMLAESQHQ